MKYQLLFIFGFCGLTQASQLVLEKGSLRSPPKTAWTETSNASPKQLIEVTSPKFAKRNNGSIYRFYENGKTASMTKMKLQEKGAHFVPVTNETVTLGDTKYTADSEGRITIMAPCFQYRFKPNLKSNRVRLESIDINRKKGKFKPVINQSIQLKDVQYVTDNEGYIVKRYTMVQKTVNGKLYRLYQDESNNFVKIEIAQVDPRDNFTKWMAFKNASLLVPTCEDESILYSTNDDGLVIKKESVQRVSAAINPVPASIQPQLSEKVGLQFQQPQKPPMQIILNEQLYRFNRNSNGKIVSIEKAPIDTNGKPMIFVPVRNEIVRASADKGKYLVFETDSTGSVIKQTVEQEKAYEKNKTNLLKSKHS